MQFRMQIDSQFEQKNVSKIKMNFDEIFQVSKKDELPGIDDWIYKLADNSEESEIDDSLLVEFLNSGGNLFCI